MKSADQYAINFPYGATDPPYGTAAYPFHRGDDRPCPLGTNLVVGGKTIGLTGNTGKVTGPHLHVQEWKNSKLTTRKPQNTFKPGTVIEAVTGNSDFGNYITVQNADGWNDSYCHLSQINVKVGDVLGGEEMPAPEQIDLQFQIAFNRQATADEVKYWQNKSWSEFLNWTLKNNIDQRTQFSNFKRIDDARKQAEAGEAHLDKTLKQAYAEIDKLRATVSGDSATKLDKIKKIIEGK